MLCQWFKVRLSLCFILVGIFFIAILLRLVQLQILPSAQLEALSNRQFRKVVKKTVVREPVYDRNHEEMAVSVPAGSIYARPKEIRHKGRVARALAKHLGGSPEKWLKKISQKKSFIWIQRQVAPDKAKEIAALRLAGLSVETESRRLYPNGSLAAHVLGFTDVDGKGIAGIELKANQTLLDEEDKKMFYPDGKGNATYIEKGFPEKEEERDPVLLTLDRRIQAAVEEELQAALKETAAKSVMAVVMDPFTGEIFAMGQAPTFDPGTSKGSAQHLLTNQLISSLYEPGSTVKPLLMATAIQEGRFKKDSLIDCGNGRLTFGKDTIHEAEASHSFGRIPLEKVIQVSSNVGAARVGMALGVDRVKGAYERFGLTAKTGIHLPGETTGQMRPDSDWVPIFLATASFGQGISTTPLQMVSSYAPFANGGYLVRPKIFKKETELSDGEHHEVRRVLSPATVETMRKALEKVTEKGGTGVNARVPGISVAGKTGTAQKYEPGKGYASQKYFSSFIGFLPSDHPQLLIGVMVDEPKSGYLASQVAAPLFQKIATKSLQLLDKAPRQWITKNTIENVTTPQEKKETTPEPVALPVENGWIMPELKGLTLKETFEVLGRFGSESLSRTKYVGTGFLSQQEPGPGSHVTSATSIVLHFSERD